MKRRTANQFDYERQTKKFLNFSFVFFILGF